MKRRVIGLFSIIALCALLPFLVASPVHACISLAAADVMKITITNVVDDIKEIKALKLEDNPYRVVNYNDDNGGQITSRLWQDSYDSRVILDEIPSYDDMFATHSKTYVYVKSPKSTAGFGVKPSEKEHRELLENSIDYYVEELYFYHPFEEIDDASIQHNLTKQQITIEINNPKKEFFDVGIRLIKTNGNKVDLFHTNNNRGYPCGAEIPHRLVVTSVVDYATGESKSASQSASLFLVSIVIILLAVILLCIIGLIRLYKSHRSLPN